MFILLQKEQTLYGYLSYFNHIKHILTTKSRSFTSLEINDITSFLSDEPMPYNLFSTAWAGIFKNLHRGSLINFWWITCASPKIYTKKTPKCSSSHLDMICPGTIVLLLHIRRWRSGRLLFHWCSACRGLLKLKQF